MAAAVSCDQEVHSESEALVCVRCANLHLQDALARIREALAGRGSFSAEDLRAAAARIEGVAPFATAAGPTRDRLFALPAVRGELAAYALHLRALQQEIDRLRCMLLARCAAIRTRQNHLNAVGRFSAAWQQTR